MLKRKTTQQSGLELVTIETLVPANNLLRKMNKAIDFSFILGQGGAPLLRR
jgi:hypothetical protein